MNFSMTSSASRQSAQATKRSCAGHGGQMFDRTLRERDGKNETIIPTDYASYKWRRGEIVDDELNALLVRDLPARCTLHCLTDTCHSGTNMDLPHVVTMNDSFSTKWRKEPGRCAPAPPHLPWHAGVLHRCSKHQGQVPGLHSGNSTEGPAVYTCACARACAAHVKHTVLQLRRNRPICSSYAHCKCAVMRAQEKATLLPCALHVMIAVRPYRRAAATRGHRAG